MQKTVTSMTRTIFISSFVTVGYLYAFESVKAGHALSIREWMAASGDFVQGAKESAFGVPKK